MDYTQPRSSFLDAYLVAADSMDASYVGVARRDRHVWRIMLFGVPGEQQPKEAFATREEAGKRLLELPAAAGSQGSRFRMRRCPFPAPSRHRG